MKVKGIPTIAHKLEARNGSILLKASSIIIKVVEYRLKIGFAKLKMYIVNRKRPLK